MKYWKQENHWPHETLVGPYSDVLTLSRRPDGARIRMLGCVGAIELPAAEAIKALREAISWIEERARADAGP